MVDINPIISIITLNINKSSNKIQIVKLKQNTIPNYMLNTKDVIYIQKYVQIKINRWGKIYHANANQKNAEIAILISMKTDIKTIKKVNT